MNARRARQAALQTAATSGSVDLKVHVIDGVQSTVPSTVVVAPIYSNDPTVNPYAPIASSPLFVASQPVPTGPILYPSAQSVLAKS
mmetsp:Transcript_10290/g.16824  ORF Transcript_10290/g.16824 Transcript_10290/m.16824 type:complete len:86 (+) Transcript_10290:3-260(+)